MADLFTQALECAYPDNPLLLVGAPGVGKSARAEQWAETTGKKFLVDHPVIAQSVDYRGLPVVLDGEAVWLPLGNLKQLCAPDCPPTVVLIDDVGQAPMSVQAALMQLVWARKLGDVAISPHVTFILATNRVEDRAGVRPMVSALVNRCQVVEVGFDLESWEAWALADKAIDARAVGYVKFRPDCFVDHVPTDPMKPFCTPRSFTQMAMLSARGVTNISLLAGLVGPAIAADYSAYCESLAKIPSIEYFFENPRKAKEIKDPGLLHAISAQAARKIETHSSAVFNLAEAIGGGWEIQIISAATSVFPKLKDLGIFKAWAVKNKHLL